MAENIVILFSSVVKAARPIKIIVGLYSAIILIRGTEKELGYPQ